MSKSGLARLAEIGIQSVAEALLSVPSVVRDYRYPLPRLNAPGSGANLFRRVITDMAWFDHRGQRIRDCDAMNAARVKIVTDSPLGNDPACVVLFGGFWPLRGLRPGNTIFIWGVSWLSRYGTPEIAHASRVSASYIGRLWRRYPGKQGRVKGEALSGVIRSATAADYAAAAALLMERTGFDEVRFTANLGISPMTILRNLHRTTDLDACQAAIAATTRINEHVLILDALGNKTRQEVPLSAVDLSVDDLLHVAWTLPFSLTNDQRDALEAIADDLNSPYPMRRILSGDVATGKTAVFLTAAVAMQQRGKVAAIMAPTRILAEQIHREARKYFPNAPVLLMAGDTRHEANEANPIVIGTTAVLHAGAKSGLIPDLLVVDEQQKFSVGQRNALCAAHTNLLEATATAIPRTQALIEFGGMDISILKTRPVPNHVKTRIVHASEQERLWRHLRLIVESGGKVAIIYPSVNGEDTVEQDDLISKTNRRTYAVKAAAERWEKHFPGRVGTLHGQLNDAEKSAVIAAMHSGQIDVLVSSVLLEVGVTLPDLRGMVIVHPERFGVSQIHQLRGRLARHGGAGSLSLFLPEPVSEAAMQRLQLLVEYNDGFILAERELSMRGIGNVEADSRKQSGKHRGVFWTG